MDKFEPDFEAVYRLLSATNTGFTNSMTVKKLSDELLAAVKHLPLPRTAEQVELLSAVAGRAGAACVVGILLNNPKAITRSTDATIDAVSARVAFWIREYMKLHIGATNQKQP